MKIKLWNLKTKAVIVELIDENDPFRSPIIKIKFNYNGTILASGSFDNKIKLWDLKNKRLIETKHTEWFPYSFAFNFNGNDEIFAGLFDYQIIKIWESKQWTEIGSFPKLSEIHSLACNYKGNMIASGYFSGVIKLFNAESKAEIVKLRGHFESIRSIAFNK